MLRIYFATYQLYFKVIIIRRRHVPLIDATGYQSIKEIVKTFKVRGIKVIISGVKESLRKDFEKNDMFSILDKEFVVKDIKEASEIE